MEPRPVAVGDAGGTVDVCERCGAAFFGYFDGEPSALARAWSTSTTASRMGLLLAVEQVLERDGHGLDEAVAELLPILQADDAALQGDTADLLGRIGHPAATEGLRALLDHPNPDVAEIAAEALEEITGGGKG